MTNIIGKSSVALVLLLTAQYSFAGPISCVGSGWRFLTTAANHSRGMLTQDDREVEFGKLRCFPLVNWKAGPGSASNQTVATALACSSEENVADAGYEVRVTLDVPGKETKGTLAIISFAASQEVELTCTSAAD